MLSFDCASFRARSFRSRAFSVINMSKTFWCFSSCLFSLTEHKPSILLCAKGKKIIGGAVLNLTAEIIRRYFLPHEHRAGYCNEKEIMGIFTSLIKTRTGVIQNGLNTHGILDGKDWKRRDVPLHSAMTIITTTSATASVTSLGIIHPLYYISASISAFVL